MKSLRRHDFIYEPNRPIPRQETDQAIADAEKLVKQIMHMIKGKDPQKYLKEDSKEK